MQLSFVLDPHRHALRKALSSYRTANVRVFGSALHGTDRDGSDSDFLVDTLLHSKHPGC